MRSLVLACGVLAHAATFAQSALPPRAPSTPPPLASSTVPPLADADLRAWVSTQAAGMAPQLSRLDVQLAPMPARSALAPCARAEPFLPQGARAWGRVTVGVRCVDGASWTTLVPVTVRAWAVGGVAAQPLAAGTVPGPADVREQEIEVTREFVLPMPNLQAAQGQALTRPLAAGQPLRADMLRTVAAVQAGDPVRLRIAGAGFSVTTTGQALSSAADGQTLRVRTELGKVLTGVAREGRVVDVTL